MKLLITGATGFIGSRLLYYCHCNGIEAVGLGLVNTPWEARAASWLKGEGAALHIGSLLDPKQLAASVQGCSGVIHLAAAQHESGVADDYFRDTNVEGTRLLLEAANRAEVERFVYGSTIGVYGSAGDGYLDEHSPPNPENIYGVTKYEAEGLVRNSAGGISCTIARISETYGPGDSRLLKLFRAIRKHRFFYIGSCQNTHQPVYVDDLVVGLLAALERPEAINETFLLAGPNVITTAEMIEEVAVATGTEIPKLHVPIWPFIAGAYVCEQIFPRLGKTPPLHRRRLDFFVKNFRFAHDKAAKILGYAPSTSFADGAQRTARWYEENGLLPARANAKRHSANGKRGDTEHHASN